MRTLYEAVWHHQTKQAPGIVKYLERAGIADWGDCTTRALNDLRDLLKESIAPSSAKTYAATLAAVLRRYEDEGIIPCRNIGILTRIPPDKPIKVALSEEELIKFERLTPMTENERYVKACFCVGARTGMRHSDIIRTDETNVTDGLLSYSSQKTHIVATVPVSTKTEDRIRYIRESGRTVSLMTYNRILRELAERAGITEKVKIHKGGKDYVKRKCDCISSHTARVTFCTILAGKGVPVMDISILAGHTNPGQTAGYIVRTTPKLNDSARKFFTN